jgi:polysaccharide export outer membrane protein
MRSLVFVCSLAIAMAGCSGPRALEGPTAVRVAGASELPPPDRSDFDAAKQPYVIGPLDKLKITVFGIEELSNLDVQTDASGRITFPMVGVIEAAGRTTGELAQVIRAGLRQSHVRNPFVSVNLYDPNSTSLGNVFTVDGQVNEPGLYPVARGMTLMRAIASSKGLTEFARGDDVVVFRKVKGVDMAALYNLAAIRRGQYSDPAIYPNDLIVVDESKARRIFKDILQAAPLITTPIVAIVSRTGS